MKGIINFSLNNKFAVWLLTIMVVIAGLYAGLNMKQETIPDIEIPILTVFTVYPGASSEEVANNVSLPLEQRVKNLSGVEVVNSTSSENVSSMIL
jgi:HAE1 family hydrophobic/amphiphilic exporter-1